MDVFKLFGQFAVRGIDEAEADIKSVSRTAEREFEDMRNASDKATDDMERGFKKSDVAFLSFAGNMASDLIQRGFDAISGAVSSLIEVAEESTEDLGKLSVAFDQAGWSAESANATYTDFVGLLGETDQAVEASNHLAELCKNEQQLAEWGDIAAGVFTKFGDSLPLENLTESSNESAKVGQVIGSLADALNWAGVSEDEFNEKLAACADESERSALITETLTGLYGEAGRAYRETNAELIANRESQANYNKTAAEAGESLLPLVTLVQDYATALLQKATPALQTFSGFITDTAVPAVEDFFGFVDDTAIPTIEKWSPLIVGVATLIGGVAIAANTAAISNGVLTAAYVVETAVLNGVATAQGVLNAVMSANPIGIVIALIAALSAALVVAWNTSEEFRNKVTEIWNAVESVITEKINAAKDAVKSAIDAIKGFFDFEFEWPDVPTPHFSISPEGWKVGDLLTGSIPKLDIQWFAEGGLLRSPTIFGASNGKWLGGGEAGDEYMLPGNMRSQFTRDFAHAIAADMPMGHGDVNHNYYIIEKLDCTGDEQIERVVKDLLRRLERKGGM